MFHVATLEEPLLSTTICPNLMVVGTKYMVDARRRYRMNLIGPFGLHDPDGTAIAIGNRKARAILGVLAVSSEWRRGRLWFEERLWQASGFDHAKNSMSKALGYLVDLLNTRGDGELVFLDGESICLNSTMFDIDAKRLEEDHSRYAGLYRGEFLEGLGLRGCPRFDEWLNGERARVAASLARRLDAPAAPTPSPSEIYGGPLPDWRAHIAEAPLPFPDKPSVCVLPFTEFGEEPARLRMGEIIAAEVSMELMKYDPLLVISPDAAGTCVARSLMPTEISRKLGVKYLLSGNVRQGEGGVRVSVTLLDGASAALLWAHVFEERALDSVLADIAPGSRDLASDIGRLAAPQIWTKIDVQEQRAGLSRIPRKGSRYELYWAANARFRTWQRDHVCQALEWAEEAVRLDPNFSASLALASFCRAIIYAMGWTSDPQSDRAVAIEYYQRSLELGSTNVNSLGYLAGTLVLIEADLRVAEALISRALDLLPAYQPTLFWGGWVALASGDAALAIDRFNLSLRINPLSAVKGHALTGIGIALLLLGRPAEGLEALETAEIDAPSYPLLVAGLAMVRNRLKQSEAGTATIPMLSDHNASQLLRVLMRSTPGSVADIEPDRQTFERAHGPRPQSSP
jgi:TolB-like protein